MTVVLRVRKIRFAPQTCLRSSSYGKAGAACPPKLLGSEGGMGPLAYGLCRLSASCEAHWGGRPPAPMQDRRDVGSPGVWHRREDWSVCPRLLS